MTEQQKNETYNSTEEITFRDLLLKLIEYFRELKVRWKWILGGMILLMILLGGRAFFSNTEYPAHLSFMINQDSGNPLGSISGVLGSFGISSKGKNNPEKVLELARSRRIVENALFSTVVIEDREDLLINHFITYLDTLDQFNKQPWYAFGTPPDTLPKHFDPVKANDHEYTVGDRKVLKMLIKKITGDPESGEGGILASSYNESSRILYLKSVTQNPDFSIVLTNTLFDELSRFYVRKTVEKQQTTYDIVKAKTDSLQYLLEQKEQQLADLEDSWLGRYSNKSKLTERRLEKEIRLLNITLAESLKNKEIADFAVRNTMPYVQIIDRPVPPLDAVKPSTVKHAVLGLLLGFFISSLVVFFRKLFVDAMNSR